MYISHTIKRRWTPATECTYRRDATVGVWKRGTDEGRGEERTLQSGSPARLSAQRIHTVRERIDLFHWSLTSPIHFRRTLTYETQISICSGRGTAAAAAAFSSYPRLLVTESDPPYLIDFQQISVNIRSNAWKFIFLADAKPGITTLVKREIINPLETIKHKNTFVHFNIRLKKLL